MAAILEPGVLVTSYDVTSLCCGPQREQFWAYYLPSKFRCHNFNILGVKRAPSRSQKTKKKQGLNRVNAGFFRSTTWSVLMEVEPLLVICYTISLLSFQILKQYCFKILISNLKIQREKASQMLEIKCKNRELSVILAPTPVIAASYV